MSSASQEAGAVLDRLDELRSDSKRASYVWDYVESGHALDASTTDFLHVLRQDHGLALMLLDGTGRSVISAAEDDRGDVRYAVWRHSAVAAKTGNAPVRVQSWEHLRDVKPMLEDRRPLVRLREETPLRDLEVPERFRRREAPGRVYRGP